ncbi:type II toxin-antitoxin system RelE/ParE family toxin [Paraburkholderia sp. EG304]|uniref:type II toxin-antitoxin system RelE/ParE family toxin n=1 Tax=Paraburkholderia sp. EG304 TaxID=3237015 RepID=UPI00397AB1A9
MLPIHWTEKAIEELEERMAFIALRSPRAAEQLLDQVIDAVVPASEHPYIFRAGRVPGTREIVAHPNYIVVYRVAADAVIVVQVLHAREQHPLVQPR